MTFTLNMDKANDMHVEALPVDEKDVGLIRDNDTDAGLTEEEKRRLVRHSA